LQPLVDRRSDHRDDILERQRKHWSPRWSFTHAGSSSESPRIYGRISATAFRTPRGWPGSCCVPRVCARRPQGGESSDAPALGKCLRRLAPTGR
jgi:hypothetical protein